MNTRNVRVWLVPQRKQLTDGTLATYWTLRWRTPGSTVNGRPKVASESLGRISKTAADRKRQDKIAALSSGNTPLVRPDRVMLGEFSELYLEQRQRPEGTVDRRRPSKRRKTYGRLSRRTLQEHGMALRYLRTYFGDHQVVAEIDDDHVESFLDDLASGRLAGARIREDQSYNTPGEQTIRKHIRTCRAIWNWARHHRMATVNPFEEFDSAPQETEPGYHVTFDDLDQLLAACHDRDGVTHHGWRSMLALCRLAGLRRDEARTLAWSGRQRDKYNKLRTVGIDWEAKRIRLVSTKTRSYRELPMVRRLEQVLLDAFHAAPTDQETITGLSPNNLVRTGQSIAHRAGLDPWADFFQAMRRSRENDWKQRGVAEPTYAKWLGHSETVSRKHYVSPTESEFDSVIEED